MLRRREEKYEVGSARAVLLREEIARHLPLFEFHPGQATTYITTLYFDTREREFFRRAEKHYDDNVKIRVKEYYYGDAINGCSVPGAPARALGSGLEALPGLRFHVANLCYVEIKRTVNGLVEKRRLPLPKRDLGALLAGRDVWPAIERAAPASSLGILMPAYRELSRYLQEFALELTSIVTYRRVVYQDREDVLRVTFDDNLRVYPPVAGLYDKLDSLTPAELGRPVRRSDKVILEIKYPDALPAWLSKVLSHQAARRLSKFTSSVRMLLRDASLESAPTPTLLRGPAGEGPGGDTQLMPEGLS